MHPILEWNVYVRVYSKSHTFGGSTAGPTGQWKILRRCPVNCFQPRLHLASNAGFSRRGRGTRVAPVLRGPEVRVVLNSSSWSGKSRVDRCV